MTAGTDREELLRRFESLLDAALAAEEPPAGIDAEILDSVKNSETPPYAGGDAAHADSYALWSAMTALTQEIKLQGRAFQELSRALTGQTEAVADELRAVYADRESVVRREAERRCRREILGALVDLRDRLGRGRESVQARETEIAAASRAGWVSRFFPHTHAKDRAATEALGALTRGYELSIERLDQTLDEFRVTEIRCEGEIFDPRTMNAIDSEESGELEPGTVMEVYRSGYEWEGEVYRTAQVKVSVEPGVASERQASGRER